MHDITERLSRLEKSNRRLRFVIYGFLVLATVMFILGADKKGANDHPNARFGAVRCDQLTVGGFDKMASISLTCGPDNALFAMKNSDDEDRCQIVFSDETGPLFQLSGRDKAHIAAAIYDSDADHGGNKGDLLWSMRPGGCKTATARISAGKLKSGQQAAFLKLEGPEGGKAMLGFSGDHSISKP